MSTPAIAGTRLLWPEQAWQAALDRLAEIGYSGVEHLTPLMREYNARREQGKLLLDERRLVLTALTCRAEFAHPDRHRSIEAEIRQTADFLRAMNSPWLLVELGSREIYNTLREDFKLIADRLNTLGKHGSDLGVGLCVVNRLGSRLEREEEIDRLLNQVDLDDVHFCPDTAHLLRAGYDPLAILQTYREGICHLHLQDAVVDPQHPQGGFCCPLGEGAVEISEILAWVTIHLDLPWLTACLDEPAGDAAETAAEMFAQMNRYLNSED